jgi:hypothetical protein
MRRLLFFVAIIFGLSNPKPILDGSLRNLVFAERPSQMDLHSVKTPINVPISHETVEVNKAFPFYNTCDLIGRERRFRLKQDTTLTGSGIVSNGSDKAQVGAFCIDRLDIRSTCQEKSGGASLNRRNYRWPTIAEMYLDVAYSTGDEPDLFGYDLDSRTSFVHAGRDVSIGRISGSAGFPRLPANNKSCDESDDYQYPLRGFVPVWRLLSGAGCFCCGIYLVAGKGRLITGFCLTVGGGLLAIAPWGKVNEQCQQYCGDKGWFHIADNVTQKLLTMPHYCNTLIAIGGACMANVVPIGKPKRSRKPGRPRLPKGQAKGRIVPVRFAPEDIRAVEAAARASNQTVSEWIRSTLNAAISK